MKNTAEIELKRKQKVAKLQKFIKEQVKLLTRKGLNVVLQDLVDKEHYEAAALVRDEINSRVGKWKRENNDTSPILS